MNDVHPFRYDQIEGSVFINIVSIYHPLYVPFIIINMQEVTVSLCTLLRFPPAANISSDCFLNKD